MHVIRPGCVLRVVLPHIEEELEASGLGSAAHLRPHLGSPATSLGCLISRIIHLEHSWPPWATQGDLPAGVLPFSKIDGLSDLQALRLPPLVREGAARDEKTKGPFLGRRRISRPDACSAVAMCWRGRHAVLASQVQRTIVSIHHFSTFA